MGKISDFFKNRKAKGGNQTGVSGYLKNKKSTTDQLDSVFDYQKKLAPKTAETKANYAKTQQRRKHQ